MTLIQPHRTSISRKTVVSVMLIITALSTFFLVSLLAETVWELRSSFQATQRRFDMIHDTDMKRVKSLYMSRIRGIGRSLDVQGAIAVDDMELLRNVTSSRFKTMQDESPFFSILSFHRPDGSVAMQHMTPEYDGMDSRCIQQSVEGIRFQQSASGDIATFFKPLCNGLHLFTAYPVVLNGDYKGFMLIGIHVNTINASIESLIDAENAILINADSFNYAPGKSEVKAVGDGYITFSDDPIFYSVPFREALEQNASLIRYGGRFYLLHQHGEFNDIEGVSIARSVLLKDITGEVMYLVFVVITAVFLTLLSVTGAFIVIRRGIGRTVNNLEHDYRRAVGELEELNRGLEERVEEESSSRRMHEMALLQQSKLSAMGEMIGAVAHQWRQPLNALGLIIQDMADAYSYGQLDENYVDDITERSMKLIMYMSNTIDDMRNFHDTTDGPELFDVRVASAEVLSLMHAELYNRHIDFELYCDCKNGERRLITDPSGDMPLCGEQYMINANRNEYKQAVMNLVTNARDAILDHQENGRLGEEEGRIEVVLACESDGYTISVQDNGGGVPKGLSERIFEPFFTTKEEGKGVGIGLYMAKTFVERNMGGAITVRNDGAGAVFTICLPRVDAKNSRN